MGDKRPPSKLSEIQPRGWLADYTTELLNVLNVLGRLIELEPKQATLLEKICKGKLIDTATVEGAIANQPKRMKKNHGPNLFQQ